jgi:potassium efflux system protein
MVIGVIGLGWLWSEVLPAFTFLEDITLWHHVSTEAGQIESLPVTLADLGLAIVIAIVTYIAAKRLPALLEIILLQVSTPAGSRYTITTLTNYAIVLLGIIFFFKMLGVGWSQVQWLIAALGVGIGFGLQEIVANFICGIIILFERPVRVGDVVTVGDTDGVVTRIQIRATTIRNWDKKELLVPNKEFVTGRLLNWSLSDEVNRLMVSVGVAYGSDIQQAKSLMLEVAGTKDCIMVDPKPSVTFESFGDNSLILVLRCFVDSLDNRLGIISSLHEEINQKFNDAGINIAFPQRDLHLDTLKPLDIHVHYPDTQQAKPASSG